MKPEIRSILSAFAILFATAFATSVFAQDQIKIANGALEGVSINWPVNWRFIVAELLKVCIRPTRTFGSWKLRTCTRCKV